ncbi:MAG: hypothetical protein JST59_01955 [Actinobacteria bacterium]|nr:hypothetical protein [Actinomycetota bacterium]
MDSEEEKEVERPRPVIKKPPVAQEVPKPTAAEDSGDVQFQKYRDEVVKRE